MTMVGRMLGSQYAGRLWSSLNRVSRPADMVRSASRLAAQGGLKVDVIDEKKGIGEICMQRPPVNGLNSDMLTGLVESVKNLEDDGCRAFLLTSSVPGVYSAGLNLLEMYGQQKPDLLQFWSRVQQMFLTLYSTRLLTVACVAGAAPAGGCLLATSCDYRLMLQHPKTVIGLSEALIGIPVPSWMRMNFCDVVGRRHADLGLQMGMLFPAEEALSIGLVDQVADSPEQLRQLALKKLDQFLKIPDLGRVTSKNVATEPLVSYLTGRLEEDAQLFVERISQEHVQAHLGKYLEGLKNRKRK